MEVLGIHFRRRGTRERDGELSQENGLRRGSGIWHDRDSVAGQLESSVSGNRRFGRQDPSWEGIQACGGWRDSRARRKRRGRLLERRCCPAIKRSWLVADGRRGGIGCARQST